MTKKFRLFYLKTQLRICDIRIRILTSILRFMEKHILSEEDLAYLRKEGGLK